MDFKKDLLLIDTELTGLNPDRHEIIQLAAVLLDKKTLKEKKSFSLYIKPQKWANRDPESMAINNIPFVDLKNAPSLRQGIEKFAKFANPKNVILSFYGGIADMVFMQKAYKQIKKPFPFDYHYFNLWPFFYAYLAAQNGLRNKTKHAGFTLDDLMDKYAIKISGSRHDALYDCRAEAEILRRIMKKLN